MNGRKNFLEARLRIAEKEWEKANKKWMNIGNDKCINALDANLAVKNSMTKMAFFNGQKKLLRELIRLEDSPVVGKVSTHGDEK